MPTHSLRRRQDFAKIYAEGEKRVGRLMVLYTLAAQDNARAVVASRRIGKAVRRNRAKRLLREAMRMVGCDATGAASGGHSGDPDRGPGRWVVLVARREIVSVGIHEVLGDLQRLVRGLTGT